MDEMTSGYQPVIEEICQLGWDNLTQSELSAVTWAYYYFSVQFRENLAIAIRLHSDDPQLLSLVQEECATDNLSPWPGVAAPDERMNHDEFIRRILCLSQIDLDVRASIEVSGQKYLANIRQMDDAVRAMSIASYEAGGLERTFKAILRAKQWDTPLLDGFRHFLVKHIGFDSDPDHGHGALVLHLLPVDRVRRLWVEFRDLLITCVPRLALRSDQRLVSTLCEAG
jgi:hypothetical protein